MCIKRSVICVLENLEESELAIISYYADNQRLVEVSKYRTEQLKILQRNEQRHITDIEKLETSKNNLDIELHNVKVNIVVFVNFKFNMK